MQVIASYPSVRDNVQAHRRAGINLASLTVEFLRRSGLDDRARAAPYPRLHALFEAVGESQAAVDEAGDWRFPIGTGDDGAPGSRLDELSLPETTPPALGDEGPVGMWLTGGIELS